MIDEDEGPLGVDPPQLDPEALLPDPVIHRSSGFQSIQTADDTGIHAADICQFYSPVSAWILRSSV